MLLLRETYVPLLTQRKRQKPRDGTTAPTKSAAESAKQMMQQKRWSRRINYDVLNNLFPGGGAAPSRTSKNAASDVQNGPAPDEEELSEEEDEDDDDDDEDAPHAKRSRHDDASDWRRLGGLPLNQPEYDDANDADGYWDNDM